MMRTDEPDNLDDAPVELTIDTSRRRRWIGWTLYILAFVSLSALLVWFFIMLNTTVALAITVVTFMVGYMLLMGYLAGKSHDERGNKF